MDWDKFTFMPGDLVEVTDPDEIAAAHAKTGYVPETLEETAWINARINKAFAAGEPFNGFELRAEYARRKAEGTLNAA